MKIIIFIISSILFFLFIKRWYHPVIKLWPSSRNIKAKIILASLPFIFLAVIIVTQIFSSGSDTANGFFNILINIVLGYSYIFLGLQLTSLVFDLHWIYDALHLNNKAALTVIIGEFLAISFIYTGVIAGHSNNLYNILFICTLGITAWIITGLIVHLCTGIFEQITIERDTRCGVRFCLYLLISGIFLGYVCSGNNKTILMIITELTTSRPVLPLTVLYIIIELIIKKAKNKGKRKNDKY